MCIGTQLYLCIYQTADQPTEFGKRVCQKRKIYQTLTPHETKTVKTVTLQYIVM